MFQNVFTCSKQALREKNKGSKYSFDSKSFLYVNVYKVLWKVLALASVPTPLPKIHFRYPTLTASRLPHLHWQRTGEHPSESIAFPLSIYPFTFSCPSSHYMAHHYGQSFVSTLTPLPLSPFIMPFWQILHTASDQLCTFTWEIESMSVFSDKEIRA